MLGERLSLQGSSPPGLDHSWHSSHRVRIGGEFVKLSNHVFDLLACRQTVLQDRPGDVFHRNGIDKLGFTLGSDWLYHSHADVFKTALFRKQWQSRPDVRIAASSGHRRTVELMVPRERLGLGICEVTADVPPAEGK